MLKLQTSLKKHDCQTFGFLFKKNTLGNLQQLKYKTIQSDTIDSITEQLFAPGLHSQSVSHVMSDCYMLCDRERSRVLTCDDGWGDTCHVSFAMALF